MILKIHQKFKGNALLLLAAIIWGFAFVAQKVSIDYMGPFTYNGLRFFIGSTSLLPLLFYYIKKDSSIINKNIKLTLTGGFVCGILLFTASSLQQLGIVFTTSGKAGFITGLYLVIVPFIGIFLKHKIKLNNWLGAIIATAGLYLLSGYDRFDMQKGDFLVFLCSIVWAFHIIAVGYFSPKINSILLSCIQFLVCSILSFIVAFTNEQIIAANIVQAYIPVLYGGLMSIGVAFTLQVVGQRTRPAEDASIILSLESLFAVIGGWIILNETLSITGIMGCGLMLTGMIISQISFKRKIYIESL